MDGVGAEFVGPFGPSVCVCTGDLMDGVGAEFVGPFGRSLLLMTPLYLIYLIYIFINE